MASTHIDALCHIWDEQAMWNGRDPKKEIGFEGATFGAIEHWADGIIVRGVLLDVPRHRGRAIVTQEQPVHGWELEDIARPRAASARARRRRLRVLRARGVAGRQSRPVLRASFSAGPQQRPGLHISCLPFLRDHDVSCWSGT